MSRKQDKKKSKTSKIISIVILSFCIGLMIFSGIKIITWIQENKQSANILNEISDKIIVKDVENREENSKRYIVDFEGLRETNSDIVAWIKVEGTNIEYPVVKGKDNSYYLTKSFDQSNNSAGWVFMDYKNKMDGTDKNIVIYGHNRKDLSMFGTLKNVFTEEWYNDEENKYITFITENEYCIYEIFSAYRIEDEDYYITTDFKDDSNFESFIKKIKSRSFRNFSVDVTKDDEILTLSTCSNANYRVAVHAKKIKE